MRAVVITAEPENARHQPDSVATVLVDLGCGVDLARFDLADLDEERLARHKGLVVNLPAVPRGLIHEPGLAAWLAERATEVAPLVSWLARNVT